MTCAINRKNIGANSFETADRVCLENLLHKSRSQMAWLRNCRAQPHDKPKLNELFTTSSAIYRLWRIGRFCGARRSASQPRNQIIMMPDDLLPSFAPSLGDTGCAAHKQLRRVEDMMTSKKTEPNAQSQRRRDQEIDARYGAIGIQAVAAAVRYQSVGKQPALKQPTSRRDEERWPDRPA